MLIDMRRVRPVPDLLAFARDNGLGITMDAVMGRRCGEIVELGHDGLLGPDLTLIHCNDMPEEGWRLIAEAGTKVTLATTSEQQLGLGSSVPRDPRRARSRHSTLLERRCRGLPRRRYVHPDAHYLDHATHAGQGAQIPR
jgi:hypothetical protein